MNLNRKFIIIGIILVIAAWAGNIFYYQRHVLKEPVFIKHYYDIPKGMTSFRLMCIDNASAQRKIMGIVFPEIGPELVNLYEQDEYSYNQYYKSKIINVRLPGSPENIWDKYGDKVITKAEVRLSDGKVMNVDLGRIYIGSDVGEPGTNLMQFKSTMGGSYDNGQNTYKANGDLKVLGITSNLLELVDDIFEININGKPLKETSFPIELKDGDSFEVGYAYKFSGGDFRRSYAYNFPLYIMVEDSWGNKGSSIILTEYWPQSPGQYDIDALIESRG